MGSFLKHRQDMNRYEKGILDLRRGSREFRSLVAGASRVVRLARVQENEHLQTIWDTGANVIGPTLFFFVWWVLEKAKDQDLRRLYFVARDGQILLKIANLINERWGYDIECRYLYGSRQAFAFPAIKDIGTFELNWMTNRGFSFISVNRACDRANISPEEIKEVLFKYGFKEEAWNKELAKREINRLKECLREGSVQEKIIRKVNPFYENAIGYLNQERLFQDEHFGIVDMGWGATSQFALSKMLDKAGKRPKRGVIGFYFGLSLKKKLYKDDKLFPFFFDLSSGEKHLRLANYIVYDIFAAAGHGKTIAFSEKDGVFHPVMDSQGNNEAIEWGIMTQQESIERFADEFTRHCRPGLLDEKAIEKILESILFRFIQKPSIEEANAYGKHIIASEFAEKDLQEAGPVISHKDYWLCSTRIRKKLKGFWPSGSLIRSNMPVLRRIWNLYQILAHAKRSFVALITRGAR